MNPWGWFAVYYAFGMALDCLMLWALKRYAATGDQQARMVEDALCRVGVEQVLKIVLLTVIWPLVFGTSAYDYVQKKRRAS